jgi:hypothetical protein
MLLLGCQSRKATIVPDELVGVWKTLNAHYADRSFEITNTSIIFSTGDGQIDFYPIAAAEQAREGEALLYTILYLNEARHEYRFTFYFEPSNGGVIRWKNKPDIEWAKARPSS